MSGPRHVIVPGLGRLPQFSHASVVGDLIFVAGTLGTVPGGGLVPGGIGPETRQTLANLQAILREAGADLPDVAKVSVYLTDMAEFGEMNRVYSEFFPPDPPPPARITLQVAGLALGAKVEIELVAMRPVPPT